MWPRPPICSRPDELERQITFVCSSRVRLQIDIFAGENSGLVAAEVELDNEFRHMELPPWADAEMTGRSEY
jgi:adenylate cyclase